MRYSVLFAGLCMVVQPIACFSVKAGLQALYGKLPQELREKRNVADFFTSKYGLGIVVGGMTLTALFLARMWYQSRQQAAKQQADGQELQQRIQAAFKSKNAETVILMLDELYVKYKWKKFSTQIIEAVQAAMPSQVAGAQRLSQLIEQHKGNPTLCAILRAELKDITDGQRTSNIVVQKTDITNLIDVLIKLAKCKSEGVLRRLSAAERKSTAVLVAQTAPEPAASMRDPEDIFATLRELYWKNSDWRFYTGIWGQAQADNLPDYLSIKTGLKIENFQQLIQHIKDPLKKRSICAVLYLEQYKLRNMAQQNAATKAAFDALSSLIKGWECGKFPQTIPEIITELDWLYTNNRIGESFVKKIVALSFAEKNKLTESEVREVLNNENDKNCIAVYSIIRHKARKNIVEQPFFDSKVYTLLLIDHLLDLILCKKAAEAAEQEE